MAATEAIRWHKYGGDRSNRWHKYGGDRSNSL